MLQANPALTPNAVKAILQFTSGIYPSYDPLTEGAGFLNAKGAVELARYLTVPTTGSYPDSTGWGKQLIWGNRLVKGSRLARRRQRVVDGRYMGRDDDARRRDDLVGRRREVADRQEDRAQRRLGHHLRRRRLYDAVDSRHRDRRQRWRDGRLGHDGRRGDRRVGHDGRR